MARHRVVVTDQVFPDVEVERALLADVDAEIEVAKGGVEEVLEVARDADALLNTYLPLDADAIGQLEHCRIIARYGIGVDNIDVAAAAERDIVVTNVPDYCIEEVAAHSVAMMMALVRKLFDGDRVLRAGGWGVDDLRPMRRLSETRVGVVGLGRIGREVVGMCRGLGFEVVGHDPFVDRLDGVEVMGLDTLLETSHVVSLHTPLTPDTRGMIAAAQLDQMRDDAVLVNASRGPLVVLDDLLDALRSGRIGGAALDVFEVEPPPNPSRFEDVPGLITSPHSAFYSEAALRESQTKAATQIVKVLSGEDADYAIRP